MSNPSIQLICSDIDGTLLDKDRELSKKTSAVFQQLSTKFPIVLISSRMPKSLRLLQQALGIENHPQIAYNGSLVRTENGPSGQNNLTSWLPWWLSKNNKTKSIKPLLQR